MLPAAAPALPSPTKRDPDALARDQSKRRTVWGRAQSNVRLSRSRNGRARHKVSSRASTDTTILDHPYPRSFARSDALFELGDDIELRCLQSRAAAFGAAVAGDRGGQRGSTGRYEAGRRRFVHSPAKDKDCHMVEGAGHYDPYYKPEYVDPAIDRLVAFYTRHVRCLHHGLCRLAHGSIAAAPSGDNWRTRRDSNPWPLPSEGSALSS